MSKTGRLNLFIILLTHVTVVSRTPKVPMEGMAAGTEALFRSEIVADAAKSSVDSIADARGRPRKVVTVRLGDSDFSPGH